MSAPLGWQQLRHKPLRMFVAILGIAFAVLLIMMQLGFRQALFDSAVRFHERFNYDIALFSPNSVFIVRPESFSIRRVYQSLSDPDVEAATPVYIFPAVWKDPWGKGRRSLNAVGFDPSRSVLDTPGLDESRKLLKQRDVVIFDSLSRPEFGGVANYLNTVGPVKTEVNNREIEVVGLFDMGTSFGIDGTIMTSIDNWLRIFPDKNRNDIQLGLIKIKNDVNVDEVTNRLREYLPKDVLVMSKSSFVKRETSYWNRATPIGYIFAFGAIMGLVVGAIVVYQILFADVTEHLNEYATLRAIGYDNSFVAGIVLQQAAVLGVLGFLPGVTGAWFLYGRAAAATSLPLYVTPERALFVFALTLGMCAFSALLAVRKVARIDPAEVF
ncbi:MAG: FtsX-like permease family protein [Gammaproteobacteria bacterium]|nr:FtsX-like permease family protein [Gammaproteobacteria bacterium]